MEFYDSVNIAKVTVITYWDKWAFANSVDPDQMPQNCGIWSVYTVCHTYSNIIFLTCQQVGEWTVSNFRTSMVNILNQKRNFRKVGLKLIRLNTICRKMCISSSLHWRPTLGNRSDNHLMWNDIVCFDKTSIFTCTHGVDISGLHVLTFFTANYCTWRLQS